ncbi:MAG: alpha/beta hydrolase-fold protein [Gemmatimonadota bacterium]
MKALCAAVAWVLVCGAPVLGQSASVEASAPVLLSIGESFTVESRALGETRRINVYAPPAWDEEPGAARPVLYMPDGGIAEDFLHIAGLLQVSVGNGTMRPFLLVGIENTQRRRDLTGPTDDPQDRTIAPTVGGSAAFRAFLREELLPLIDARYPTTGETAIMGESLAGLFVVETLALEPELFDTYIAFDPSVWWNREHLVEAAPKWIAGAGVAHAVYLACSSEPELARLTRALAELLRRDAPAGLKWHFRDMPEETHATIYHPAALHALRWLFKPEAAEGR